MMKTLRDGTRKWYNNGRLHREDGPAIEYPDGGKEWYRDGLLHREDGPAVERADGSREWRVHGMLHRENGPAFEGSVGGYKAWLRKGLLHRDDGPALEFPDGSIEWWREGKRMSSAEIAEAEQLRQRPTQRQSADLIHDVLRRKAASLRPAQPKHPPT